MGRNLIALLKDGDIVSWTLRLNSDFMLLDAYMWMAILRGVSSNVNSQII